jgi:chitin synthase
MNAFNSNIYLAEDRVLCLSLVAKENEDYVLRYVWKSVAETDVPEQF